MIQLTELQTKIMGEFYSFNATKVIYNKKERKMLWSMTKERKQDFDMDKIKSDCPALSHQILKSYESGKNIQSAVFSECVYAQTLANMLCLNYFFNCLEGENIIQADVLKLLQSYSLVPRYVYCNEDRSRMLIQAGGRYGIDCALVSVKDLSIFTIEFKEPGAKTSEPDLPKYEEDGKIKITEDFLGKYPQFKDMIEEHKDLNFFEVMGNNIHDFSPESVNIAVTNNYTKKYADIICTEDSKGYLVMMPVNQVSLWAKIEGEIRPSGRNNYKVWNPQALKRFLDEIEATYNKDKVTVNKEKLALRYERGGSGKVSGYKINPLFFVYIRDCTIEGNLISFDIDRVRQLKPTIAGKLNFKGLNYFKVKEYYGM